MAAKTTTPLGPCLTTPRVSATVTWTPWTPCSSPSVQTAGPGQGGRPDHVRTGSLRILRLVEQSLDVHYDGRSQAGGLQAAAHSRDEDRKPEGPGQGLVPAG